MFASFFVFFFWLPDLSSLIAKCMLVLALPTWWMTRSPAASFSVRPVLVLLLPLLVYLFSMALHGWDARQLSRPAHLLLAVGLLAALRDLPLQASWIVTGQALSVLPALGIAIHEHSMLGKERVFGPLSGADFGNFAAALAMPLLLGALLQGRHALPALVRALCFFSGAAAVLIAFWSGSRTGWITMPIVAVLLVALGAVPEGQRRMFWVLPAIGIGLIPIAWPQLQERVADFASETSAFFDADTADYRGTSMGIRLESARLGLQLCAEHPFLGLGVVDFKRIAASMARSGEISPEIPGFFGMLHNQFLDFCVLLGVGGTLVLLVFWFLVLRRGASAVKGAATGFERLYAMCLVGVCAGYFVSATGGSMFSSTKGTVMISVCLLLLFKLDSSLRARAFHPA